MSVAQLIETVKTKMSSLGFTKRTMALGLVISVVVGLTLAWWTLAESRRDDFRDDDELVKDVDERGPVVTNEEKIDLHTLVGTHTG